MKITQINVIRHLTKKEYFNFANSAFSVTASTISVYTTSASNTSKIKLF